MARGSIEKRGNLWSVRYYDTRGNQRRQSGFRTKDDAEAWLAIRLMEQRQGIATDNRLTFEVFARQYLAQHHASAARLAKLGYMLRLANDSYGNVALVDLTPQRIGGWAKGLSEGTRHDALAAVKQVLKAAVDWGVLARSPAAAIKNPVPKRREAMPFEGWEDVEAIERAINPHYRGLATFAVGTGMRPQEWTKLRWEHVDWAGQALRLPANVTKDGRVRKVPLRRRVLEMLANRRGDTGLVFTSHTTRGAIDMHHFRRNVWGLALKRAGLEARRPYDMRHTYATWALRAGLNTFAVARRMGTSLEMIDQTYGHHATDSEDHERSLLDAFDGARSGLGLVTSAPEYDAMGTA